MAERNFRTPRARALGLGTAGGTAVDHWWTQRLTSISLIPLTLLFVFPFASALGSGYEAVIATYRNPFHAIVAVLTIGVTFHHHYQGLQVVIEDYVHHKAWAAALMIANAIGCGAVAFAGIFAVLKIAFTG